MSRQTALLEQPGLWDEPAPTPPPEPTPPSARNHALNLPRPWPKHNPCMALCLVCGRPEDLGVCEHGCAIVCSRPRTSGPVEICITLARADAVIVISPISGYMHLLVRHCPHCTRTHWHAGLDHPHRTATCGKPYILNIKEPRTP